MSAISPLKTTALAPRTTWIYAFWSSLWILLSDRLLLLFGADPQLLVQLSTLKGWFFTLITSLLLYNILRRGEQAQRESYLLLCSVIEGTRDAVFVKDRQGRYVLINSSGAQMLGRPIDEIIGREDREFMPAREGEPWQREDSAVLLTGQPRYLEEEITVNGSQKTYLTDRYPRFNGRGEVEGLIGIARDISDRQQLQREREALLASLQAQNQELEALNLITANAISTLDLDALLNVLLDRLLRVTGADLGLIFLRRDDDLHLGARMGEVRTDEHHPFRLNRDVARLILSTGKLIDIENLHDDQQFHHYANGDLDTRHILGLPLRRQQHLVGVLQIEWHQPHQSSDREVHLLEIAAERCAAAILNAQLFEQTQQLQQRLQLQFERTPIGCVVHDDQGRIIDWNPAAEEIFGYTKAEVMNRHPRDLIIPAALHAEVDVILGRILAGDMTAHSVNANVTKAGREIICEWYNTPLRDLKGEIAGFVSMVQEVTERVRTEERLRQYAYYDPVTRLPLRQHLLERLETLLEVGRPFAVLHFGLRRFRVVKYSFGHQMAEQVVLAVVARCQDGLPAGTVLARLASDEFAVLLERATTVAAAREVAGQLEALFAEPFVLGDRTVFLQTQIGLAWSEHCPPEAEGILRAADTAMHQARLLPNTSIVVFDPDVQEQAVDRLQLDAQMRRALKCSEFQLYYQPIVHLKTQQLAGFEALLRWPAEEGWISPEVFIPLAEETGFIIPLGEWVLRNACAQFQQWRSRYPEAENLALSVNVSTVQLLHSDLLATLDRILAATGLPPQALKLEVTETTLMRRAEQVGEVLAALRSRQIRFCIDDFGTGYSSLSYLRDFSFDTLKIDRSFVMTLERDPKSQELVRTIIMLGKNLGLELVAEGVETREQLAHLRALDCDQGQGYLLSRPLPPIAAELVLTTGVPFPNHED